MCCLINGCMKIIGIDSSITENLKASHALVHISSKSPFTTHSMSPTAKSIIIEFKTGTAKHKIEELLAYVKGNKVALVLWGYIFKWHAIEVLEKGGTFTYQMLVHGNMQTPPDEEMDIPSSTKILVDKNKVTKEKTIQESMLGFLELVHFKWQFHRITILIDELEMIYLCLGQISSSILHFLLLFTTRSPSRTL